MKSLTATVHRTDTPARWNASRLLSLVFVAGLLGCAYVGNDWTLAIYSLSFWHYYLYWLAYYFGAVSLGDFKGDAILMKALALSALGYVYLAAPLDFISLAVVACGFLLNSIAAWALGSDRTYYGYEVADLPPRQVTRFPYSWISHPMLVGNIAAFGGTMLNADFRRQWWSLACTHVFMNLGLLVMELAVTPQRRSSRHVAIDESNYSATPFSPRVGSCLALTGSALAVTLKSWGTWTTESPFTATFFTAETLSAAAIGACIAAYSYALYCCYSAPNSLQEHQGKSQMEEIR